MNKEETENRDNDTKKAHALSFLSSVHPHQTSVCDGLCMSVRSKYDAETMFIAIFLISAYGLRTVWVFLSRGL